jgi:hypothetical protein
LGWSKPFRRTAKATLQPVDELIDMQIPTGKIEGGGINPLLKKFQRNGGSWAT